MLGGVTVPADLGLGGHSDADVLTHAVCEALLGALALGDLGRHFPDTDPRYSGVSSLSLLREVKLLVEAHGGTPTNVDATVLAESPRLSPFLGDMARRLADALGLAVGCVSVKAKSPEGLGLLGRQEGIAAMAAVNVDVRGGAGGEPSETNPDVRGAAGGEPSETNPDVRGAAGGEPSETNPDVRGGAGGEPSGMNPNVRGAAGGEPSGTNPDVRGAAGGEPSGMSPGAGTC